MKAENAESASAGQKEEAKDLHVPESVPSQPSSSPIKIPFISRFRSSSSGSSPKKNKVFQFTLCPCISTEISQSYLQIPAEFHPYYSRNQSCISCTFSDFLPFILLTLALSAKVHLIVYSFLGDYHLKSLRQSFAYVSRINLAIDKP